MKTETRKRSFLAILFAVFALVLSACSGATLNTELNLESETKGSRIMNLTIESSEDNSEVIKGGNDAIDASIKKHKPEGIDFSGITTEGDTVKGTFTINFDSVEDYRNKATALLKAAGKDITPEITIANNTEGLVTGTTINENFTSADLLGWIGPGLVEDGVIEKSNQNSIIKTSEKPTVKFAGKDVKVEYYSSGLNISDVDDNGFSRIVAETTVKDDSSLEVDVQMVLSEPPNSVQTGKIDAYLKDSTPDGAEVTDLDGTNSNGYRYGKSVKFTADSVDNFNTKLQKLLGSENNKLEVKTSPAADDATAVLFTYSGTLDCVAICSPQGSSPRMEFDVPSSWTPSYDSSISSSDSYSNSELATTGHFSQTYERKLPLQSADVLVEIKSGTGAKATFTYVVNTEDAKQAADGFRQMFKPDDEQGSFEESEADGNTTYTAVIEGSDQEDFNNKLGSYIPDTQLEVNRPSGLHLWPSYEVKLEMPVVSTKLANLQGSYAYELKLPALNSVDKDRTDTTLTIDGSSVSFNQDSFDRSEASQTTEVQLIGKGPALSGFIVLAIVLLLILIVIGLLLKNKSKISASMAEAKQKREAEQAQHQQAAAAAYAASQQQEHAGYNDDSAAPTVPLNQNQAYPPASGSEPTVPLDPQQESSASQDFPPSQK